MIHRSTRTIQTIPATDLKDSRAWIKNLMKKRLSGSLAAAAILAGLCLAALPAHAQANAHKNRRETTSTRKARIARTIDETYGHRYEVGGGGGFLRFRSGPFQQQDIQVTFWASTLYSLNSKLGVVGEVRGGYGHAKLANPLPSGNFLNFKPQISDYNFMAGPSYRFVRKEKFSASVFAEGGLGLGKFAGDSKGLSAADIGVWTSNYSPSFSGGVNLDYNFYPNLAVRVTPSYLGTAYSGSNGSAVQNSKNLNIGVVYRFGRIK